LRISTLLKRASSIASMLLACNYLLFQDGGVSRARLVFPGLPAPF
jgi:hypothetical protein